MLTPLPGEAGASITAFVARVNTHPGEMGYVDAGRGLALILSLDGTHRRPASSGPSWGTMAEWTWDLHTTTACCSEKSRTVDAAPKGRPR